MSSESKSSSSIPPWSNDMSYGMFLWLSIYDVCSIHSAVYVQQATGFLRDTFVNGDLDNQPIFHPFALQQVRILAMYNHTSR